MLFKLASHLKRDKEKGLTVRPEPVEGGAVKPFMVRQAHHERLNLNLSRLKWVAFKLMYAFSPPLWKEGLGEILLDKSPSIPLFIKGEVNTYKLINHQVISEENVTHSL